MIDAANVDSSLPAIFPPGFRTAWSTKRSDTCYASGWAAEACLSSRDLFVFWRRRLMYTSGFLETCPKLTESLV